MLPEEISSSPEEIEEVFSLMETYGVDLVDADTKEHLARPEEADAPERPPKEEDPKGEPSPGLLEKTNDPVRMYLREMGTVPLLTREGEVSIARRIQRGERRVLKALSRAYVLGNPPARRADPQGPGLGEPLRGGRGRGRGRGQEEARSRAAAHPAHHDPDRQDRGAAEARRPDEAERRRVANRPVGDRPAAREGRPRVPRPQADPRAGGPAHARRAAGQQQGQASRADHPGPPPQDEGLPRLRAPARGAQEDRRAPRRHPLARAEMGRPARTSAGSRARPEGPARGESTKSELVEANPARGSIAKVHEPRAAVLDLSEEEHPA